MSELKRLSPQQSRRVNALIRKECCNCFDGNCILLDDGESCVCPQLMPLVNMGSQNIFVLSFCYCVGKLPPDFVRLFIVHFPRLKGLYQMMCEVVSFFKCLRQGKSKLNICRFIGAAERGNKDFFICLVGVLDIVKGFAQRAFNRLNLCNRHISASTPFISSMSSW